jgi:hypothetical protein
LYFHGFAFLGLIGKEISLAGSSYFVKNWAVFDVAAFVAAQRRAIESPP